MKNILLSISLLFPLQTSSNTAPPLSAQKYGGIVLTLTTVLNTHGYSIPESFRLLTSNTIVVSWYVHMSGCKKAIKQKRQYEMKWWKVTDISCLPLVNIRR